MHPTAARVVLALGGALVALAAALSGVDGGVLALSTAIVFYAIGRDIHKIASRP